MIKYHITEVVQILVSKIETHDLGDSREESRAIEVVTTKGEKALIILEGRDVQFHQSGD